MEDNEVEEAFLQAPDPKDVEKKSCNKKGAGIGVALVIGVLAVIALLVGLFCQPQHVKMKRIYIGSMEINNKQFLPQYEEPGSAEFTNLAAQVCKQVRPDTIDPRLTKTKLSERKSIDIHIENSGHVESPGFPNSPYPSNAYLQWKFRADPQHRIQLDFDDLILEDDCQRDFIKIYDSLVPIEKRAMTEQCGYPHQPLSFISSGNVMLLMLVTDEEKNFPGFRANYSPIPQTTLNCGGTLTGEKGSISSPFFPSNYPPRTTCVWNIEVANNKFLKVLFNKFSLGNKTEGCGHDYVEINGE
ncbi:suppressor of tumorigenicity 14 protein homolog, partial [Pundamilia nyererei]|uniref:Suppressor of tumorigenicity 14 protein homolog n=1 Tax=Pundamilia nyererei TaxID=303518 RepID=A0A9Y3VWH0_9CICH